MALLTEEEVEAFTIAQDELGDHMDVLEAHDFSTLADAQAKRKQGIIMAAADNEAHCKMKEVHNKAVEKMKKRRETIAAARRVSVAPKRAQGTGARGTGASGVSGGTVSPLLPSPRSLIYPMFISPAALSHTDIHLSPWISGISFRPRGRAQRRRQGQGRGVRGRGI